MVNPNFEDMEIEITKSIELAPDEGRVLDLHSFLNILNVIEPEIELLEMGSGDSGIMAPVAALAGGLRTRLGRDGLTNEWAERLAQLERVFEQSTGKLLAAHPDVKESLDATRCLENIRSVFRVLDIRVAEYLARAQAPGCWVRHDASALQDKFTDFFAAVERNSKGRYRIISNIAAQEERDYVVNLRIEGASDGSITMPPELQDVFRDLVANARKYTRPGGVITAGLFENNDHIRIVVEDNGVGIPPDELERVVDFGYRASNVRHLPTKGGGFGLTKAYLTTKQHGGRMWIRSAPDVGTRITIDIPRPTSV